MRRLAASLPLAKFQQQMGPFVLIQRPPAPAPNQTAQMGVSMNAGQTQVTTAEEVSQNSLAMLFQFEELLIATLPPMGETETLTVGRLPDCDLVLDDPSVSKRHAVLKWDAASKRCSVTDQNSTNGTYLNASVLVHGETVLKDGDILSFGDAQFWFLLTPTLHGRLASISGSTKLKSHSG